MIDSWETNNSELRPANISMKKCLLYTIGLVNVVRSQAWMESFSYKY